jgi:hypothetical protein
MNRIGYKYFSLNILHALTNTVQCYIFAYFWHKLSKLESYEENFFRNADGCFIAAAFCSGIVYAEKY